MIGALAFLAISLSGAEQVPLAYLKLQGDSTVFIASVTEGKLEGKSLVRTLNVICDEGCNIPVKYIEMIEDYPLGIFRLSDVDDNIVTTWVAGSTYAVRIYSLSDSGIKKSLELKSISTPVFSNGPRGKSEVSIFLPNKIKSKGLVKQTWQWNGKRFILVANSI